LVGDKLVDVLVASFSEPLVRILNKDASVLDRLAVLFAKRFPRHDVRLLVIVIREAAVLGGVTGLPCLVLVHDRLVEVQLRHRRVDRSLPLPAQLQRFVVNLPPRQNIYINCILVGTRDYLPINRYMWPFRVMVQIGWLQVAMHRSFPPKYIPVS